MPLAHFRDTCTIRVPLPRGRALPLFTARGERAWAHGWEPTFPAGEPEGEEHEGTVFVTEGEHGATYWVVVSRSSYALRYARVTPDLWCGTVEVSERRSNELETELDVTYDLTALTDRGAAELETFAVSYQRQIESWQPAILAALRGHQGADPGRAVASDS